MTASFISSALIVAIAAPLWASPDDVVSPKALARLAQQLQGSQGLIAAQDIEYLGSDARSLAPVLVRRIPQAPLGIRPGLFVALRAIHADAGAVVPALAGWLKSNDEDVRTGAAITLGDYKDLSAKYVPTIVDLVAQHKINFEDGAQALGAYGPLGIQALPFLESRFSLPEVDGMAIAAALQIAPQNGRVRSAALEKLANGVDETKCRIAVSVLSLETRDEKFFPLIARIDLGNNRSNACMYDLPVLMMKKRLLPETYGRRPAVPKEPGMRLVLTVPKGQFMVGERIPVTLHLSYSGKKSFYINDIRYDRSGRMNHLGFDMRDSLGNAVEDPLLRLGAIFGGGISSQAKLSSTETFTQTADLNEWFRPDRPGKYVVTASPSLGPFTCVSESINIEIVPATESFIKQILTKAKAGLASGDDMERERSSRDLRFLQDDRAIPLLIEGLEDPSGNVETNALFGLRGFRNQKEVERQLRAAMQRGRPKHAESIWKYADLLARAESGISPINVNEKVGAYYQAEARWRLNLESAQK